MSLIVLASTIIEAIKCVAYSIMYVYSGMPKSYRLPLLEA